MGLEVVPQQRRYCLWAKSFKVGFGMGRRSKEATSRENVLSSLGVIVSPIGFSLKFHPIRYRNFNPMSGFLYVDIVVWANVGCFGKYEPTTNREITSIRKVKKYVKIISFIPRLITVAYTSPSSYVLPLLITLVTFLLFVPMVCRNICERIYSKIVVGESHYSVGKKYCRRCECQ